jgi:hypothetical protein
MKLWLLRPINQNAEDGPWDPWYDRCFGFVVRAESADAARRIAAPEGGSENPHYCRADGSPWLDEALSSCVELSADGAAEIVIQDVHYA